jgi:hypothetical protein
MGGPLRLHQKPDSEYGRNRQVARTPRKFTIHCKVTMSGAHDLWMNNGVCQGHEL